MILQRLEDMAGQEGQHLADALKQLAICRGGFTEAAAIAILGVGQETAEQILTTLRTWQFVALLQLPTQTTISGMGRYVIDPLVSEAIGINHAVIQAHRDYYVGLVKILQETGAYTELVVELANIQAAFEYALNEDDIAAAYLIYSVCSEFLMDHGYHTYHLHWIQQLSDAARDDVESSWWSAVQNSLGVAYQNAPTGDRRDNLRQAITAYREAIQHHPPAGQTYALAQHNLGTAYADLARIEDRAENLWRAIDAYEEALRFRTATQHSRAYAATQHHLGDAYRHLASVENRAENLERAIHAYEEALSHYTNLPLELAATRNSLGNAYHDLAGIENRTANLRRAVEAYEHALEYRTPQRAPLAYAATKNNIGTAYRALANEEQPGINLQWAIAAFKEALYHYSPQQSPLDYAATQNNIGSAYRALAEIENQAENLGRALSAFENALSYYTPKTAPLDYATTQANLGFVWRDMGHPAQAIAAWREALCYFQQMGATDKVELMHEWIARAENK